MNTPFNYFSYTPLKIALCLYSFSIYQAHAQEVASLAPIQASIESISRLRADPAQEQAKLERVAGGTNLIHVQNNIRLNVLRDALDYQPGLVIQDFFGGNDQPRLNIRGSGIQSNPVNRGVLLMQDGLPLNEADGSFIIGLLEPKNSALISVRRGANAIAPGATTLGGEIDFLSLSGADNNYIGLGFGSDGQRQVHGAYGFEEENMDGRFSFSHSQADGYRHHSNSKRSNFQGNLGFKRDNFENRTYLSYTDLFFQIPNIIPRERLMSDPRSVTGDYNEPFDKLNNVYTRDPHRDTKQFRLANISQWGNDQLNQRFGIYWQTIDDTFSNPTYASPTKGDTYGAQWSLNGHLGQVNYRLGLHWSRSDMDRDLYVINPKNGSWLHQLGSYDLTAENRHLSLGLAWNFQPDWTLTGDVKWGQAIRNAKNHLSHQGLKQDWTYASPKLGLIWQANPDTRLYANISRSHEAPTFWEIIHADVAPQNPRMARTSISPLNLQTATTVEIGGNGKIGQGQYAANWGLSLYRNSVKNELMSVSTENGTPAGTFNYQGGTRHQGLEAGLFGQLPGFAQGHIDYRLAYTFSDFRFRGGEYAGKRIAGVPRHLISAELLYSLNGWKFGPNIRWIPSKTPTTHANIPGTEQDSYFLLGFKVAYEHSKHWSAYLTVDNLLDKRYASSYVIRNSATPNMPTFLSGTGRSFSAGVSFKF